MEPVYQTIIDKENGNCMAACIASLLELPLEAVPNFSEREDWFNYVDEFLEQFDLEWLQLKYSRSTELLLRGYYILSGDSPNFDGVDHVVIGHNGEVVHDPNPDGKEMTEFSTIEVLIKRCERGVSYE